jgi:tellurite resistance protein
MQGIEAQELLKAVLAVAVADGELRRSERGVIEGLATRVGLGRASLDAMIETAEQAGPIGGSLLFKSKEQACRALELLVATARIDGDISDEERAVIVRIATSLNLDSDEFRSVYEAGIERADKLRASRRESK